ncbi:hypothetical protein L5515_010321 [Caenorhabditis briggsae]|uniref:Uncharacterized protein n=1 Tax=Caenorhabditis briggsae TaxID=6238 RepID=A0AAE9ELS5_CAEBR|nr:hypothetical protein L5515_010321 [Caenorhabditis briggsae]
MPSPEFLTSDEEREILLHYEYLKQNSARQAHSNLCQMIDSQEVPDPPPSPEESEVSSAGYEGCVDTPHSRESFSFDPNSVYGPRWDSTPGPLKGTKSEDEVYPPKKNYNEADSDDETMEHDKEDEYEDGIELRTVNQKFIYSSRMMKSEVKNSSNSLVMLADIPNTVKVAITYGKVKLELCPLRNMDPQDIVKRYQMEYWRGNGGTWLWYQGDVRFVDNRKYQELAARDFIRATRRELYKLEIDFEEYNGWNLKIYPFTAFFKKLEAFPMDPISLSHTFKMKTYAKVEKSMLSQPKHLEYMISHIRWSERVPADVHRDIVPNPYVIELSVWDSSHLETRELPALSFESIIQLEQWREPKQLVVNDPQISFSGYMKTLLTFNSVEYWELKVKDVIEISKYMKGLNTRKTKRCSNCIIYSKIPINIEFQHYARHRFFINLHGFPRRNYRREAMFIEPRLLMAAPQELTNEELTNEVSKIIRKEFKSLHTFRQAHRVVWDFIRRHDGLEQRLRNEALAKAERLELRRQKEEYKQRRREGTLFRRPLNPDGSEVQPEEEEEESESDEEESNDDDVEDEEEVSENEEENAEFADDDTVVYTVRFVRRKMRKLAENVMRRENNRETRIWKFYDIYKALYFRRNNPIIMETRDLCFLLCETAFNIGCLFIEIETIDMCSRLELVGLDAFLDLFEKTLRDYHLTLRVVELRIKLFGFDRSLIHDTTCLLSVFKCLNPGVLRKLTIETVNHREFRIRCDSISSKYIVNEPNYQNPGEFSLMRPVLETGHWRRLTMLDTKNVKMVLGWETLFHLAYIGITKLTIGPILDIIATFTDHLPRQHDKVVIEVKEPFEILTFIQTACSHILHIPLRVVEPEIPPEYNFLYFRTLYFPVLGMAVKPHEIHLALVYPRNRKPEVFTNVPMEQLRCRRQWYL